MKKCCKCIYFELLNDDKNGICNFWETEVSNTDYCIEFKRRLENDEEDDK